MDVMDKPPQAAISKEDAIKLADEMKRDKLVKGRGFALWSNDTCFIGNEVVQWLIETGRAKDVDQAISIGQSLLDHRLAHHTSDDHQFKNENLPYKFFSDEPIEIQQEALLFDEREKNAKLAGFMKLRSEHFFSAPTFYDCYSLLVYDDKTAHAMMTSKDRHHGTGSTQTSSTQTSSTTTTGQTSAESSKTTTSTSESSKVAHKELQATQGVEAGKDGQSVTEKANESMKQTSGQQGEEQHGKEQQGREQQQGKDEHSQHECPNVLYIYKYRSAPTPMLRLQVQDCNCSMKECVSCLADHYCFTINTSELDSSKSQNFSFCVKNGRQMEAWMFALQNGGLEYESVEEDEVRASSIFELSANDLMTNEPVPLEKYKGKICLIVNVSSKCAMTPRDYPQLVELHKKYQSKGFEVLAFPCNQFANQEPGGPHEIKKLADEYGVEFPIFAKVDVNGEHAHPVFRFLKQNLGGVLGNSVKWNFTKFLCDHNGKPFRRYAPITTPTAIKEDIEFLLNKPLAEQADAQKA